MTMTKNQSQWNKEVFFCMSGPLVPWKLSSFYKVGMLNPFFLSCPARGWSSIPHVTDLLKDCHENKRVATDGNFLYK